MGHCTQKRLNQKNWLLKLLSVLFSLCMFGGVAQSTELTLKVKFDPSSRNEINEGYMYLEAFKVSKNGEIQSQPVFTAKHNKFVTPKKGNRKSIKIELVNDSGQALFLVKGVPIAATISFQYLKSRTETKLATIWLEKCNGGELCKSYFELFIPPRRPNANDVSAACNTKKLKRGPKNRAEAAKMYSLCQSAYHVDAIKSNSRYGPRAATGWHRSTTKQVIEYGRGNEGTRSYFRLDRKVNEYIPMGKAYQDEFEQSTKVPEKLLSKSWNNAEEKDDKMVARANRRLRKVKKTKCNVCT